MASAAPRGDLSPSKISLHPFSRSGYACLRQFFQKYVAKRRAGRPGSAVTRGNAVHKILELAAKARVDDNRTGVGPVADLSELLAYMENALGAVGAMLTRQGFEELRTALELMAPVDFSHVLAVEKAFRFDVDGVSVVGKIDRIDDGLGSDHGFDYLVIDYKSGGVQGTSELADAPQTLIYLEAMHELFPGATVGIVYDFVRRDHKSPPIAWTPETSVKCRALIKSVWDDLEERKLDLTDASWPGSAGGNCKLCPYTVGCEPYDALMKSGYDSNGKPLPAPAPDALNNDDLLREYVRARDAEGLNGERRKECGKAILERIGGGQELAAGDLKAKSVVTPKNEIHLASLIQGVANVLGVSEDAARASLVREVVDPKKLKEVQARCDKETRAKLTKVLEEAKIPVSTSAHVRIGAFDPFGEGASEGE